MKKVLFIAFLFLTLKGVGQDMIYLADGNSILGKIKEITKDSVKYTNLANPSLPFYGSYAIAKVKFAFNAAGNYLIFDPAKPFTDKEKAEFIASDARPRLVDIAIALNGKPSALAISSETEAEISGGKDVKFLKDSLAFVIRKNGNHELFCAFDEASQYLVKSQPKIDSLLAHAPEMVTVAETPYEDWYVVLDLKLLGRKVIAKVKEFVAYVNRINSVESDQYVVDKCVSLAEGLFLNHGLDSRVEVSNIKTAQNRSYNVPDYLNMMKKKVGRFDKVIIEYADVKYYTKFRKGTDGNYYGTVTFIQRFRGFNDGNFVFCEQTKRNMIVVLPHYPPARYDDEMLGWGLYLGDIGVVETEK